MVPFTFDGLFMTTNMGLPDLNKIPASTSMTKSFFVYSLILQSIIFLVFLLYFILSIYRVVKKIKNSKFQDVPDDDRRQDEDNGKTEKDRQEDKEGENEKNDNLVYRFDDEEEEEEKQKDAEGEGEGDDEKQKKQNDEQKQKEDEEKEQNYDDYHDEREQAFIELDNKLLFLQPFLISFIVCNGIFSANLLTIIFVVLMLISFFIFNIKQKLGNIKPLSLLFIVFSILGYISFFAEDHDITT